MAVTTYTTSYATHVGGQDPVWSSYQSIHPSNGGLRIYGGSS